MILQSAVNEVRSWSEGKFFRHPLLTIIKCYPCSLFHSQAYMSERKKTVFMHTVIRQGDYLGFLMFKYQCFAMRETVKWQRFGSETGTA